MSRLLLSLGTLLLLSATVMSRANEPVSAQVAATDPGYHLIVGDTIAVSVYGEPDLSVTQTIGRSGEVRLPLLGEIILTGKTVREAVHFLENTYQERQFLRTPVVDLVVTAYFPREVSVLGAVRTPGTVVFPRDVTSLDIVEVITRVGGFLAISKSDAVTITHRGADGKETVKTVDLENTISGRRQAGRERADLAIYPGDRIWVPERLF
jgi:protein involved in polysaccharide export with SLBB domain